MRNQLFTISQPTNATDALPQAACAVLMQPSSASGHSDTALSGPVAKLAALYSLTLSYVNASGMLRCIDLQAVLLYITRLELRILDPQKREHLLVHAFKGSCT